MKTPPLPSEREVFAFPLRRGWGYCQVLGRDKNSLDVVGLDQWSEQPLALPDVSLRVLRQNHHSWPDQPHRLQIAGPPPASFVSLGVASSPATTDAPRASYAMWESLPVQFELQLRWNALPEAARAAFYAAQTSGAKVHFGTVTLSAAQRALTLDHGTSSAPNAMHFDGSRPIDFSVFDAVTGLLSVNVTGNPPGLIEWLASRPMIESLAWRGALPAAVDLRATGLQTCALFGDGRHEVWLPTDCDAVSLAPSPGSHWNLHAHDDGALLALTVRTRRGESFSQIEGLRRARSLSVTGFMELDLRAVTERYSPRALTLHGAPGDLRSSDALSTLTALEVLECWRCLDVDAAHMPPLGAWPRLQKLWVVEALDTESAALKARWGRDRRVSVRSPHDADWARDYARHPLRGWSDLHKGGFATGAYANASRKIGSAADVEGVRAVMRTFIKALNRAQTGAVRFTADEVRDLESVWATLLARSPVALDPKVTDAWLASERKGW